MKRCRWQRTPCPYSPAGSLPAGLCAALAAGAANAASERAGRQAAAIDRKGLAGGEACVFARQVGDEGRNFFRSAVALYRNELGPLGQPSVNIGATSAQRGTDRTVRADGAGQTQFTVIPCGAKS